MASRGVNKVILVGNLGGDPETRYMPSGNAMTTFSVATGETWKDKQTGQQQERTEWHRVVIFGRLAEIAAEYLKKGSKVYLEGSIKSRRWQDQQTGQDRYGIDIVATEMQMLDSRGGGQQGGDAYGGYNSNNSNSNNGNGGFQSGGAPSGQGYSAPSQGFGQNSGGFPSGGSSASAPAEGASAPPKSEPSAAPVTDSFDDDIPF